MNHEEALRILNIKNGSCSKDLIKSQYRHLAAQHHPDRPTGNVEKMQKINIAYQWFCENFKDGESIDTFFIHGVTIIKDGIKTIVLGKTFSLKEFLKKNKFKWDPDKKHWWRLGNFPIQKFVEFKGV